VLKTLASSRWLPVTRVKGAWTPGLPDWPRRASGPTVETEPAPQYQPAAKQFPWRPHLVWSSQLLYHKLWEARRATTGLAARRHLAPNRFGHWRGATPLQAAISGAQSTPQPQCCSK
jgi:hypothetical protein